MTTTPTPDAVTSHPEPGERAVLAELTEALHTVIPELGLEGTAVTMDTRFVEDLDLESIDLVTLTAELGRRYGDRVDFPAFFASLELTEIIGLSAGRMVRYITGRLG
ncbi:acyl carrier protein [Streptomyces hesseae]|uniref:Acyl carrier protein n=1 Tax=Streptomyces hesseae TaxID=3075519 RepID=A0ABU2SGT4_9ACTN|nr:phosphopantetheine-binding protein [Streptomyces sp. DSM 40473]MDT0448178.1 acyl carrier protein [Streptomyces sp. DSM 40473]